MWLGVTSLRLVFANAVFHKSLILLIFEAGLTENAFEILSYPESIIGPTLVGQEEIFEIEILRRLETLF